MNSLSVSDNIKLYNENIQKLIVQKSEIEKEMYRLEGSIRIFENFKKLGIETIQINNDNNILENTEVIDNEDAI